ncbi:hypothetical protein RM844_31870 [Streptomyces sp. DSM 44915]|uniref:Uncharacterized protein n=1 Tax=Streptomyces chisholmiae TaxID=3075540 RepID=A0ABU2K1C4_9ACTN|nr:hypothetical protein [Streptomyces sp. DSM 44915]MDT0270877.1 hypothetical protein [Streptomyces sp. DSM 44915]
MNAQETAKEILENLSPEARILAKRVLTLEREYLHVKNPTLLTSKIMDAAKELAK